MNKHWLNRMVALFNARKGVVPREPPNELDWKIGVSANKDRLIEHLIAFVSHANGGCGYKTRHRDN